MDSSSGFGKKVVVHEVERNSANRYRCFAGRCVGYRGRSFLLPRSDTFLAKRPPSNLRPGAQRSVSRPFCGADRTQ